jgi:23S rRNA (uracil1939-C5)-methyltransferase
MCGGCELLHETYPQQLARKASRLRHLLGHLVDSVTHVAPDELFVPCDQSGDPAHFRHKVSFVFGTAPRSRRLIMGHHARASSEVIAVDHCFVHARRANRIAFALRNELVRAAIPAAGPTLTGIARHVIVRTTTDESEALAMLVVTRNDKRLRTPVRAFLDGPDRSDGFFINVNQHPGPLMVSDRTLKIDGRTHVRERIDDLSYLLSPTAFFQTNPAAATSLQRFVVGAVSGAGRVLDLYCGSGLFSLPLARDGSVVVGVEEHRQAVADAEANRRLNKIPSNRVRFMASRVEIALRSLEQQNWDAVILDPPRQGLAPSVLTHVFGGIRPRRAVYVSCNPEALAEELPHILRYGYRADDLRAVDMFPHTEHIESVVRLSRT